MKLSAHGFAGDVIRWIKNWLTDRKQRVVLNGQCSGLSDVLNGVPPLLFVISVNDIDDGIAGKILKFADDTKIFYKVGSANDIDSLRNDLNNLVSWSKEWQMLFNVEKCKVMHIGYNVVLSMTWMEINRKLPLRKRTWDLW